MYEAPVAGGKPRRARRLVGLVAAATTVALIGAAVGVYFATRDDRAITIPGATTTTGTAAAPPSDAFVSVSPSSSLGSTVSVSADGANWTTRSTIPSTNAIAFANGVWLVLQAGLVAAGSHTFVRSSTDLVTWQLVADVPASLAGLSYGNGMWMAVGWGPTTPDPNDDAGEFPPAVVYASHDTKSWQRLATLVHDQPMASVVYGAGTWLTTGDNRHEGGDPSEVMRSTDGVHWATVGTFDAPALGYENLARVAFGDGRFVAGGAELPNPSTTADGSDRAAVIRTSRDGTTWNLVQRTPGAGTLHVAYGNHMWLGIAENGEVYASADTATWAVRGQTFDTTTFTTRGDLAFGRVPDAAPTGGSDVFVGSGSLAATTSDGVTWTSASPGPADHVAFGNGRWLTAAIDLSRRSHTTFASSSDLVAWQPASELDEFVSDLAFGDGVFLAVANTVVAPSAAASSPPPPTHLYTSRDGTHWNLMATLPRDFIWSVAHGGGRWTGLAWNTTGIPALGVLASTDGVHWTFTAADAGLPLLTLQSGVIAYGAGRWVVTGGTTPDGRRDGFVSTSADGVHWRISQRFPDDHLYGVAYGSHRWLALGASSNRTVWSSTDGTTWTLIGHTNAGIRLASNAAEDASPAGPAPSTTAAAPTTTSAAGPPTTAAGTEPTTTTIVVPLGGAHSTP